MATINNQLRLTNWLKQGKHLPSFMRDFHDQERLFKRLDEIREEDFKKGGHQYPVMPDWATAHIYVIDFFLWFMGRRGYTLQKSQAKHEFMDICQDLEDFDKRELESLGEFIKELSSQKTEVSK